MGKLIISTGPCSSSQTVSHYQRVSSHRCSSLVEPPLRFARPAGDFEFAGRSRLAIFVGDPRIYFGLTHGLSFLAQPSVILKLHWICDQFPIFEAFYNNIQYIYIYIYIYIYVGQAFPLVHEGHEYPTSTRIRLYPGI